MECLELKTGPRAGHRLQQTDSEQSTTSRPKACWPRSTGLTMINRCQTWHARSRMQGQESVRARKQPALTVDASRLGRDHPDFPSGTPPPKLTCQCSLHVRGILLVAAAQSNTTNLYDGPPANVLSGNIASRPLARFGETAHVQYMRFFHLTPLSISPGMIVLAVVTRMRMGFVHLTQFTTVHDPNEPVDWRLPAAVKLRALEGMLPAWVADFDGTIMQN